MRHILRNAVWVMALLGLTLAYGDTPMTKLTIHVTSVAGRPVDQASVVVRFVRGHALKIKALRTTWELRTNQEGVVDVPDVPQGQIRIQIIAKGFQTYGQLFDVAEDAKTIDIKLNPPQQQYTSH